MPKPHHKTFFPRQSRYLTDGEKILAKSVFGDSLQLENITLNTANWVLKGYAVSPNGHIYFHPSDFIEDFSEQDLAKRAWFIHELTHVWQVQQGINVFVKALFNRKYRYRFVKNKPFLAYGVEQQARMVEEYYLHREQSKNCDKFIECIPFLNHI